MLSVFRELGVVAKDSRDNINKTAENRSIYQLRPPRLAGRQPYEGMAGLGRHLVALRHRLGSTTSASLRGMATTRATSTALLRSTSLHRRVRPALTRAFASVRLRSINDEFRLMPIPLPPLEEQRAIADYLDRETARIDTLIEEQQRLIEMLRERRAVGDSLGARVGLDDEVPRRSRLGRALLSAERCSSHWQMVADLRIGARSRAGSEDSGDATDDRCVSARCDEADEVPSGSTTTRSIGEAVMIARRSAGRHRRRSSTTSTARCDGASCAC